MKTNLKNIMVRSMPNVLVNYLTSLWRFYSIVILKDEEQINLREWNRKRGDEVLRIEYDLNSASLVFDLGGYMGDFTEQMNNCYSCSIYMFEPVKSFYDVCTLRFQGQPKIKCFNFGLSSTDGEYIMSDEGSSSSILKSTSSGERVRIVDISRFLDENHIENIDLIKINIEGGEYDVLDRLIETESINKCKYLQIQFHKFIENADEKRNVLRERLSYTHRESWCHPFIWESWERIEN